MGPQAPQTPCALHSLSGAIHRQAVVTRVALSSTRLSRYRSVESRGPSRLPQLISAVEYARGRTGEAAATHLTGYTRGSSPGRVSALGLRCQHRGRSAAALGDTPGLRRTGGPNLLKVPEEDRHSAVLRGVRPGRGPPAGALSSDARPRRRVLTAVVPGHEAARDEVGLVPLVDDLQCPPAGCIGEVQSLRHDVTPSEGQALPSRCGDSQRAELGARQEPQPR